MICLGQSRMDDDAFFFSFFNFFSAAGISARFSRHTRCTSCAPSRKAERETSIISRAATASMLPCDGSKFSTRPRADAELHVQRSGQHPWPHCRRRSPVPFTDGEPIAQVDVEQEIDALVDSVQIHAGMVRSRLRWAPTAISTASKSLRRSATAKSRPAA